MTDIRMPTRLGKTPLLQAIFEIRFIPTMPSAGDVLVGLVYNELKSSYPMVMPLPIANLPRQIRDQDVDLQHQASHRLGAEHISVQVGDRVASLSTTRYPGWAAFRPKIQDLMNALQKTALVKSTTRFSFRYINVIPASESESQLPLLNSRIEIVNSPPTEKGFQLRSEVSDGGYTTVIQIATRTSAQSTSGDQHQGLLVDLDTIRENPPAEFLGTPERYLEEGHHQLKQTFYALLAEQALKRLAPEY